MKGRIALYVLTLIAYTLSLAHSVIPHHHHDNLAQAREHSHSNGHHHHHHSHEHNNEESPKDSHDHDTSHLFFLTHVANSDVLIKRIAIDGPVKLKKIDIAIPRDEQIIIFELLEYQVFQPPQDADIFIAPAYSTRSLRAPPAFIS
jgi:hypothetical protein